MAHQGQRRLVEHASPGERVRLVFAFLDELISSLSAPPRHRELLGMHLAESREQAEDAPRLSAVQLPLLVHAAVTGEERPALPLAGACTLLRLGTDLFDDVLDLELSSSWRARDPAEPVLAATTLGAALPQLAIARLEEQGTPPAKLWALSRLFSETLLAMSAGQHEDVLLPSLEDVSLEDSRAMVERKSGSEAAMFARAGAILTTDDDDRIGAFADFGSCLGMALQLKSDVLDIWGGEEISRDLLNGKRTLPVVHALATLRGGQHERLREVLLLARESAGRHDEVRALLAAAGSVRYAALIVYLYQQQARKHLAAASPREPAGRELRALLDGAALISPGPRPSEGQTPERT